METPSRRDLEACRRGNALAAFQAEDADSISATRSSTYDELSDGLVSGRQGQKLNRNFASTFFQCHPFTREIQSYVFGGTNFKIGKIGRSAPDAQLCDEANSRK